MGSRFYTDSAGLQRGDELLVQTMNSAYRLKVLSTGNGRRFLLSGGRVMNPIEISLTQGFIEIGVSLPLCLPSELVIFTSVVQRVTRFPAGVLPPIASK